MFLAQEEEEAWTRRDKADVYAAQQAHLTYALLRRLDGLMEKSAMPDLGPERFFLKTPDQIVSATGKTVEERKADASRQMRGFVAAVTRDPSVFGDDGGPAPPRVSGPDGLYLVG